MDIHTNALRIRVAKIGRGAVVLYGVLSDFENLLF